MDASYGWMPTRGPAAFSALPEFRSLPGAASALVPVDLAAHSRHRGVGRDSAAGAAGRAGADGIGERMRVLLVEDDQDLQRLLKRALSDAGYVVDSAADGEEGHFLGDTEPYDVVILDLGLPKMDGVRVLESWRKSGRTMPVLILTARDRWSDKVAGFDAGADDYLAKPFYTEELLARVRALLRRAAGLATSEIEIGPLRIDTRTSRVTLDGNPVKLTSLEYRLLAYLAHHKGRVVSRTELVEHLYDQDFDRDSNTIEVFVGRLRRKLDSNLIQTVRGLGYCLDIPGAAQQSDHA
jgi:two-component system OmpR family response regulator